MGLLAARGLSFRYVGARTRALDAFDVTVREGELALLAGPSGGGKTTAALGLAGLLGGPVPGDADGTVMLDGRLILGRNPPGRPGDVGLVQQDPEAHICTLTVADEVAFGPENLCLPREEVLERVASAIAAVGGEHLLGRRTNELSGGEKQRVAIASVLAMRPHAMVLDEPTANLDPPARAEVLAAVRDLAGPGMGPVVVAEHRLDSLIDHASEVVVMDSGRVRWRGDATELEEGAEDLAAMGVRVPGRPDLLGLERPGAEVGDVVLSVRGLVAGYGDREVLGGIDLEVAAGELVALVGPNGGGKTTLMRCVLGLARPWEGDVKVAGLDAREVTTSALARRAGLVFQSPDHQLFESTVARELEFGPRNMGLLDQGTLRLIGDLSTEYGLDGMLDVHPFRLSMGQKRRLNIASVLASSPRLLMLDEPFIGQDLRSVQALNARLQGARRGGAALLVVSHDLEALSLMADRALLLDGGVVQELDDPSRLDDLGRERGWGL